MYAKTFYTLFLLFECAFADEQLINIQAEGIMNLVHEKGANATLVNMWATWCAPCLQEFPALVKLAHNYQSQGLRVIFVSNDLPSELPAVKKFINSEGVDFPTYIKAQKDNDFINGVDAAWTGALPATFIYDRNGKLVDMHEGPQEYDQFAQKIKPLLLKE